MASRSDSHLFEVIDILRKTVRRTNKLGLFSFVLAGMCVKSLALQMDDSFTRAFAGRHRKHGHESGQLLPGAGRPAYCVH